MGSLEKECLKSDFGERIENVLPIVEEASPSIAGKNTVSEGFSVLLVDDNHINLQILVAYVKKEGWDIMTATDGLEAVEIFQAHPGKFAAVIIGMLNSIYTNTF
jgi:response regulator RpfG family c-di-GMP phosphodiesterase